MGLNLDYKDGQSEITEEEKRRFKNKDHYKPQRIR